MSGASLKPSLAILTGYFAPYCYFSDEAEQKHGADEDLGVIYLGLGTVGGTSPEESSRANALFSDLICDKNMSEQPNTTIMIMVAE